MHSLHQCGTLIPGRVLSFVALQSNKGRGRGSPSGHTVPPPADKRPSLSSRLLLLPCMFLLSIQNEKEKQSFQAASVPCYTKPALIHFTPTDGGDAPVPSCSHQPGFTQLPSGVLVTLHKIVMPSHSCWALPLYIFLFFSRDSESSITAWADWCHRCRTSC